MKVNFRRTLLFLPQFIGSIKGRVAVGVCALVLIGLVASDTVGVFQLKSYLTSRIDGQINSALAATRRIASSQPDFILKQAQPFKRVGSARIQAPSPVLIVLYGINGDIQFVRYNQLGSIKEPLIPSLPVAIHDAQQSSYFLLSGANGSASDFRARLSELPNHSGYVLVAVSLDELNSTINHLEFLDLIIGVVVLGCLVTMTYLMVWFWMRPLIEMEYATDAIARGDLSLRLDSRDSASEIRKLRNAFNAMLSAIEVAFNQVKLSERESKKSQDQLRRFVADAGHELRTPLTSILGYSELLQNSVATNAQLMSSSARRIQQESQRMSGLVEELLLLAQLDQKKSVRFEPVDILELVADGVQDAKVIQPERNIRLEPLNSDDLGGWSHPVLVLGDDETLRQVVSNLINNALFHTPVNANITVRVGVDEIRDGAGITQSVVIEVEDSGFGIPKEALEHLFERFYRVDDNRGFDYGGFGLGLSVVESVVKSHEGVVSVESEVGKGTCFRVTIPSFMEK